MVEILGYELPEFTPGKNFCSTFDDSPLCKTTGEFAPIGAIKEDLQLLRDDPPSLFTFDAQDDNAFINLGDADQKLFGTDIEPPKFEWPEIDLFPDGLFAKIGIIATVVVLGLIALVVFLPGLGAAAAAKRQGD